jgi:hypothetical protein
MREARFKQLFPNVPLLPKKAFQSHRHMSSALPRR